MAKDDDIASKRLAEVTARANARFTDNLRCAFHDLLLELKRAYGQPARDAADMRSQHKDALLAIAIFLEQTGPEGDRFADRFAMIAQMFKDLNVGVRDPILTPAVANRGDTTMRWLARVEVVRAIETLRWAGYNRKKAAQEVIKKQPGLQCLVTENVSSHRSDKEKRHRSGDIEAVMISWCRNFSRRGKIKKIKNSSAARVYSDGMRKLETWALGRTRNQIENEAARLLRKAMELISL
jgi:hypothetical protein